MKEFTGTRRTIRKPQKALTQTITPHIEMSIAPGTPSSAEESSKKQRKTIDLSLKMKIIKAHNAGKKVHIIAWEEGLAHSTICRILKDQKRIQEVVKGSAGTDTIITRYRTGFFHQTEQLLVLWIEDQIRKGIPIGFPRIRAKTCSIFAVLKEQADKECYETFTASRGWFLRFQQRFNYQRIPTTGETAVIDEDAARHFPDILDDILAKGNYLPEQIFSVDDIRLLWKKMPTQTYLHREAQAVPGNKTFEDQITLLLSGNVAGFKLKPFLIHKAEDPHEIKNLGEDTLPVYYQSDRNIWMTHILLQDWLMTCFIPQVREYCSQNRIPFKILLLLDNTPGYPPHLDNLQPDVKVVYLPKNTSPVLKPMQQGAITIFKASYLRAVLSSAVAAMEDERLSLREFWKRYSIFHCIKNIAAAWQGVGLRCMQGIWEKCLKRFADLVADFEGFEPRKDLEKINQSILTLSKALDLQVDAEDVKNWMASTEGELSNDDLIKLKEELEAQEMEEEDEQQQNVEVERKKFTVKRLASVFSEVDKVLSKLESMDPEVERFEKVCQRIQEILKCYHEIYEEEKKGQHAKKP